MTGLLKQSTTQTIYLGPFVDDSDFKTAETGLSLTVRLSKNGGAAANRNATTAITHDSDGFYRVELNATDTNSAGRLVVYAKPTGALIAWATYLVVPAAVFDGLVSGSSSLPVDAAAVADAVWDEALSSHTTSGSAGQRLSAAAAYSIPTAAAMADAVWDEALSSHTASGSAGAALSGAGAAGDPWTTTLPGGYTSGQAGHIVGTYLDAAVSSMGAAAGAGAIPFTYTLTSSVDNAPIADADVWVSTDSAGTAVVASGRTGFDGTVVFWLDAGPAYIWRRKPGWNFTNPDVETISN